MEEKIRVYIDRKFKPLYWVGSILVLLIAGSGGSSYFLHRELGKVETTVTYLKNARYVERDYFELYMEKLGDLIVAHESLCDAVRHDDLTRIVHIEKDISEIKIDIRNLGNKIGLQTRSGNKNSP